MNSVKIGGPCQTATHQGPSDIPADGSAKKNATDERQDGGNRENELDGVGLHVALSQWPNYNYIVVKSRGVLRRIQNFRRSHCSMPWSAPDPILHAQLLALIRAYGDEDRQAMADKLGVHLGTLNHWISGRRRTPAYAVKSLAAQLAVDMARLKSKKSQNRGS